MRRGLDALGDRTYDLLVVGGGIYGAWIAYDASLRGLRTALLEARDWGAGTSSASSKLIHGGLRYLEQYAFGLVRRSLDERRRLARLGPHRIRPLRLAMPVRRDDRVPAWRIAIGLWLYDRLGGRRGRVVGPSRRLAAGRFAARYPLVRPEGLAAGFVLGDGQTDDARMVLEIVDGARAAGAALACPVEATRLLVGDAGRIAGVAARDRASGRTGEVRAALTVDCTGPWSGLLRDGAPRPVPRLTRGTHLVLPALAGDDGYLLASRVDRRIVFVLPWYGRTLVGTTDTDHTGDPGAVAPTREDVDYLLARAAESLRVRWSPADVIGAFAGLRAFARSADDGGASPSDLSREWVLDEPRPGLVASIGGKYTSARADAERAVELAFERLGRRAPPSPTATRPFPWAPPTDPGWHDEIERRATAAGIARAAVGALIERHGAHVERLLAAVERDPRGARPLVPDLPFVAAEIGHAFEHEMAGDLDDVLRRRVPLRLLARPGLIPFEAIARLAGEQLGWSASETAERAAAARRATPGVPPV